MKNAIMMNVIVLFLMTELVVEFSSAQTTFWHQSDGPYGGYIQKIVSNSQGHLFAIGYSRFFKSTDSGATWHTYLLDSMKYGSQLGGICIDSSGRILLGHEYGISISSDEGETWTDYGSMPITGGVVALTIDSAGTLFAGIWGQGLFSSSDGGRNWTCCSPDSLIVFCFCVERRTHTILAGCERGIYRSSDGGATWNFINLGDEYWYCQDIQVHSSGIFCVASIGASSGVYQSTDDGITWNEINTPLSNGAYALTVTKSGRIIVGGGWGMFASDDSGVTWTQTGLQDETAITLCSDGNNRLYAGTSGLGVYVSSDDGQKWQDINNGIIAANIRAIASDNSGHVYAAWRKRIARSSDFGETFQESFRSTYGEVSTVAVDSKGRAYAVVMDTILISTDYGASWNVASATGIWPWVLCADPDDNLFTMTPAAVYRSSDEGHTWVRVWGFGQEKKNRVQTDDPIHVRSKVLEGAEGFNIAFASDGTGYFSYEAHASGALFRSTDHGLTWSEVQIKQLTTPIYSLAVDQAGFVFIGSDGSGMFRSTDRGDTWSEVDSTLPMTDRWIRDIVPAGEQLITYTWSYLYPPGLCVYRSTNEGVSWFRESSGLPDDFVTALAATPDGHLYAGTQFNGFYRSQIMVSAVETKVAISQLSLFQNYPNPFNPTSTIAYSLPQKSSVTLKLYDLLGREVRTIVSGEQEPGDYKRIVEVNDLPSGVYFYRLQAGTSVDVKKMLILK